jgi:uncharacterized protein (DUF305 family)
MRHSIFALMAIALTAGAATSIRAAAQTVDASTSSGPTRASLLKDEAPFLAENTAAMDKMMSGMAVKPSGNVDADFAAMMIPHHQGAIDMALAELRYGKNEQLRRIAQEIVVDQQQEIVAMHLALGQPLPPPAPAPTQVQPPSPASKTSEHTMQMPMDMNMKKDQPR